MVTAYNGAEFGRIGTFAGTDPVKVIRARSRLIALPQNTLIACINDIESWYKHNGAQWTVDRLKFIKQCAIRYLTMGELPPKESKVWMRKNRKGLFYGHWGTILKLMVQRPKSTALFLQCYTAFAVEGQPTENQIQLYKETLEKPFQGDSDTLNKVNSFIELLTPEVAKRYFNCLCKDISHRQHYLMNARANNFNQLVDLLWVVKDFLTSDFGQNVVREHPWVMSALDLDGYQIPHRLSNEELSKILGVPINVTPFVMANINWIHEPGLKERIVADFVKVLEFLTYSFGKRLYDILKMIPWDATYHEERGYETIKAHLNKSSNTTCYCFDLSKATDRFPLSTQVAVIRGLEAVMGPNFTHEAELFIKACHEPARLPNGELTHWEVGQPMGAYPSFALFSLTHGMVLMSYLESKGQAYTGQFVVHGDDLVILDGELARYYECYISVAGAEINNFKTIISSDYAELNSRLVTRRGFIRFPKWKPITPSSIMDQVQTWGASCVAWCYKSQAKQQAVRDILAIPHILPNGQSINPEGKSEMERFISTPDKVLEEILYPKPVEKEFTSFRQRVLDRFRQDDFITHCHELSSDTADLYLHMLLANLDVADTLDKEILQGNQSFIEFMTSIPSKFITFDCNNDIDIAMQTLMTIMPKAFNSFYELFGYEDIVHFSGYAVPGCPSRKKKSKQVLLNTARLNKLVKLMLSCRRAEAFSQTCQ